ncbi:hypothetical protein ACFQE0_15460 [Methylobacterium komagatae]|uniref:Uncharacterized protein n=1 Tax=Methylobacterium komagatae TaxID=374425 RepID=A0ABW2BMR0_9HYPH
MPTPRQAEPHPIKRLVLPPRPITGTVAQRRSREARIERGVLGVFLLLALTVSGFASYAITEGARPYAVQALLPSGIRNFAWKASPGPERPSIPNADFDPVTTGALPDRRVSAMAAPEPTENGSYTLRRISGGVAVLSEAGEGSARSRPAATCPAQAAFLPSATRGLAGS